MVIQDTKAQIETIKAKIEAMIEKGYFSEARILLDQLDAAVPGDIDVCSMRSVIYIAEGELEKAESTIKQGLRNDSVKFDLIFNLAYLNELKGLLQISADFYNLASSVAITNNQIQNVNLALDKIKTIDNGIILKKKKKIVFFVKEGMDSFLGDIIEGLSDQYWVRKVIVSKYEQIDEGMIWADICWFEWCDELVEYGSKSILATERKIICRIHGYEVYTDYIRKANWGNIDKIIIVAPHIKRIFEDKTKDLIKGKLVPDLIYCGLDTGKYPMTKKAKGYNLGYIGYINYKKNIPMTLDIFRKLHTIDDRYKLFIAGRFQEDRTKLYFEYFVKEYGLEDSIFFEGWLDYDQKLVWLKKIDYMVISSIDEGLCYAAAEAMCSGIKPVLHNCEGLKDHYVKKYLFGSVDEAVDMILSSDYDSKEYNTFIEENYSNNIQLNSINILLEKLGV